MQNKLISFTFVISILVSLPQRSEAQAWPSRAVSLQETLQTAFAKNPRTAANRQRLEALEQRSKAAWLNMWPSLSLSYSQSNNRSSSTSEGVTSSSQSKSFGPGVGVHFNLYNGGADYYSAKAAESRLRAQEAIYNSTNALIPNTKGAIANLVASAFFDILVQIESIEYLEFQMETIRILLAAAQRPEDRTQYQNQLDGLLVERSRTEFALQSAKKDFEFVVTDPAPKELETLDQVIQSLEVPADEEEAIRIAFEQSPDIVASRFQQESIRYQDQATKARLFSPRVDVGVYRGRTDSEIYGLPPSARSSTTVSATISWNFSLGSLPLSTASTREVEASESDFIATTAELRNDLNNIYADLRNRLALQRRFAENLQRINADVQRLIEQAQAGQAVDVNYATNLLNTSGAVWSQNLNGRLSIAGIKFRIQRTIGSLFDAARRISESRSETGVK